MGEVVDVGDDEGGTVSSHTGDGNTDFFNG